LSRNTERKHPEENESRDRDQPRTKQHKPMLSVDGALCTVATPVCVVLA
jgi:hypothetical protein